MSLVDGYNLPIKILPVVGTYTRLDAQSPYDCGAPECVDDLNLTCPGPLAVQNSGKTVACLSACEKFSTDETCCRGAYNTPETCPPTSYSQVFKKACPSAYSYAYDDKTSTFTCRGGDYQIIFCPKSSP